jgi:hypothetical protein
MDDRKGSNGKLIDFTAAMVASAALVHAELQHAGAMMAGRTVALNASAPEPPRSEHTDPEAPTQPGFLWVVTIAGTTTSAASHETYSLNGG